MTPKQPPKIAIIGAGPTGCMLARLLLHLPSSTSINPPTVHIFEFESSPNYRSQGGTLDLHPETGLAAMQAAGLFDKFLEKARYDSDALQITDKDLNVFLRVAPSTKPTTGDTQAKEKGDLGKRLRGARPEIDRGELRRILIESLPVDTIRWGMRVKGIYDEDQPATKKTIHFANSPPVGGYDLVVGADGAWSKIRPYLSSQKPIFSKIGMFDLSIPNAETVAPRVYESINRGNLFAYGTGKFVAVQMMGDGSVNVYAQSVVSGEDWMDTCGWYFPEDLDKTRRELVEGPYKDWHEILKEAIVKGTGKCIPRTLYQLPVGFRWEHKEGATLIGDAAHLMTPYAGEGVNVGLMDALVLGRGIVEAIGRGVEGGIDHVVREYEKEMWPRAEEVARLTDTLKGLWMFTEGAPGSVIAKTTTLHAQKLMPWVLKPVVKGVVHLYYWGMRMVWGY